jgi:hypothetical protein
LDNNFVNQISYGSISAESIEELVGAGPSPSAERDGGIYVVGQGLNAKGTKLLSRKLACMTIGDLEAILDLKNMNASQVSLLLSQLKDLVKALVSAS